MAKKNEKIVKPTREETKAAVELQKPVPTSNQLLRVNTFKQLTQHSRSARVAFGGTGQWVKPENLFNPMYRSGLESPPFYITKAFQYESKGGFGSRIGLEIVMANGHIYNVGLPYREDDSKRTQILAMFKDANAEPVGPNVFTKLDLGKGNDYYDIQPYESGETSQLARTEPDIPFIEIPNDPDVPF